MNLLTAKHFGRKAWRGSVLLAGIFLAAGLRADTQEPNRFLLVFETSPTVKKNLPLVKQSLDGWFSSNLQHELQDNDDLAVWTVDQDLHTGTFPLASWAPSDAEMYSSRLKDFLDRQKFSRHASLAAVQPLLNRIVKNSPQLTVLIICDSQSSLLGTPYDSGVNAILKKTAVEGKGTPGMFVLVLRSYQGEYLGSSVNRMTGLLSIPPFPAPPKPEPPVVKPAPVAAPAAVPVPALIIVGTNVGTNVSALAKPAPMPATNATPANPLAETSKIVSTPNNNPNPVSNPPPPAPPVAPAIVAATNPPAATNAAAVATAAADTSADAGFQKLIFIGGGLLVAALGLVVWLATRSRRPRGSLITSSMQDDPRLPPRK